MRWMRLGAVTCTLAVAALVGCGTSGGSTATTTTRPTTTQRQTTTTQARTTTTAARTTMTTSPGVATPQDWLNKYTDEWLELSSLMADIPQSLDTSDPAQVAALRKACVGVDAWATRMDDTEAVPDPDLDEELGNMIEDAWSFSEDCIDGIDQQDIDLLEQSIDHFHDFQDHVARFSEGIG